MKVFSILLTASRVDRANHDVSDDAAITRQKIKEFMYKTKYMSKLCLRTYATYEDVVGRALKLEQLALIDENAKKRSSILIGNPTETRDQKDTQNSGDYNNQDYYQSGLPVRETKF